MPALPVVALESAKESRGVAMTRWLRRFWIWINTPPIDVIAPPDFELRRKLDAIVRRDGR